MEPGLGNWNEFVEYRISRRWSGNEIVVTGQQILASKAPVERTQLVHDLVDVILGRGPHWDLAAGVVESLVEPEDLAKIEDLASRALDYPDMKEEYELTALLRILARGETRFHSPLEQYLGRHPLPMYYSVVPWSLWPAHPERFAQAQCRFLSENEPKRCVGTAIVQAYLSEADALKAVRENCGTAPWWKYFAASIRTEAGKRFVTEAQRQAILDVLSGDPPSDAVV